MRRARQISIIITIVVLLSSAVFAFDMSSGSYNINGGDMSGLGGTQNSNSYNSTFCGSNVAGSTNSSSYSVTLGECAAIVEPPAVTTTTTTTPPEVGGLPTGNFLLSATAENSISGITVASGSVVNLTGFKNIFVNTIEFKADIEIIGGSVSVSKISADELSNLTGLPLEKSIGFIKVTKTGITESSVGNVNISFFVPKSVLTQNGAVDNQIVLERYDGSSWKILTTGAVSSDSENVYFKANSPGLSYFAISLLSQNQTTGTTLPPSENATTTTTAATPTTTPTVPPYTTIIIIILLLAVVFWYFKKKE